MEESFQENLEKEYKKIEKNVKKPNILLLGGTGVGKSSLTNLVFGKNIAKSGIGKPITQEIHRYEFENTPVVLFDSVGYEIEESKVSQEKYIEKIIAFATASAEKPIEGQIHLVWYLIQSSGHRVTEWDLSIINKIKNLNIPISVVFTKCDLTTEEEVGQLVREVKNEKTFQVTTSTKIKPLFLELNNLIQWSCDNLQEGLREAFVKAQKVDLDLKRKSVKSIILQHTTGNAGVGFTPIPFSDAPILLASQAAMTARILYLYDLNSMKDLLPTLLKTVSVGALISSSGKWIVGEIIKFIPVVGTVVGGLITGAVAATFTFAIGTSVSEICYTISKYAIKGEEAKLEDYISNLVPIFKNLMKENSLTKNKI